MKPLPIIRPSLPAFPSRELAKNPVTTFKGGNPRLAGAPVVFSAQATLPNNKSAVLNAQTLQSGFRTPYFIDEIRITMHTSVIDLNAFLMRGITGLSGLVQILFQTGSHYFSNDAVPVGVLAPLFGVDYGNEVLAQDAVTLANQIRSFSNVRWMLPKPLYMPAGDVVLANVTIPDNAFLASVFGTNPCITVTVTYVGRLIPQGYQARERHIPWVAWWTKKASESVKDANTRLRNPFTIPAHVQRFTQRTYSTSGVSTPAASRRFLEESHVAQLYLASQPYESIIISDSRGYAITNKYVPIGDVFDPARHAWTFGRELSSREQFNMTMRTENFSALNPTSADYITNVGVIGYRTENAP